MTTNIKINSVQLGAGLRALTRLAKPDVVTLHFKDRVLKMKGAGESSSCMLKIELDHRVREEMEITLDINLLTNVIDKRKELELSIKGSSLLVQSGKYEAEVLGIEGQSIVVVPKDVLKGDEGIVLKNSFMNQLLRVLPALELKPLLSTYSEVPVGVKATKKGTFVACFDFIQSASVMLPDVQGDFEFILPSITQFNILAKELSGQKYKIVITDTTLYAWNDMFQVNLSLPQQDGEQLKLEDIMNLMREIDTQKFKSLTFKTEPIQQFIGNSRSVYDKDSIFTVDAKDDRATIELKATVGNTKLKTKLAKPIKPTSFKCDLTFFASIVSKTKEKTINLKINDNLLRLKVGPISYLLSLV
jgi:hypothetical protein